MSRSKRTGTSSFPGRNWVLGAVAIVAGTTLLYGWIIASESSTVEAGRVAAVVALFLIALACSVAAAVLPTPEGRHLAAAAGAGLLVSMGSLTLLSIGAPLFIAAGLLILAIGAGRSERRSTSKLQVILAFVIGAALPWGLMLVP